MLNSVVSLFYYARIIKAMFLEDIPETPLTARLSLPALSPLHAFLLFLLFAPTLVFGIYWAPLIEFAEQSARLMVR